MKYYSLIEIDDDIMPVHFKKGELPYPVSELEDEMKLKHKPQTPKSMFAGLKQLERYEQGALRNENLKKLLSGLKFW